jgi:hypothetical protein
MEPLTLGQKFAFACVVLAVISLSALPFVMGSGSSSTDEGVQTARGMHQATLMAK